MGITLAFVSVFRSIELDQLVLGLLGLAKRYLTADGAALRYLRESSLPIYILHSPAIVLVGYWVIQLDAGIPEKFALTLAGSVALALLTYHFAVRRLAKAVQGSAVLVYALAALELHWTAWRVVVLVEPLPFATDLAEAVRTQFELVPQPLQQVA